MKKLLTLMFCTGLIFSFQNCSSSKKVAKLKMVSYKTDLVPILQASCTPCHFPPDGQKAPLNNYDAVKTHIADIIKRVKLPSTDQRFMPWKNKKPALSDSAIKMLELWQTQGMAE